MFRKLARLPRRDLYLSLGLGFLQGMLLWLLVLVEEKGGPEHHWWRIPAVTITTLVPLSYFAARSLLSLRLMLRFLGLQALLLGAMAVFQVYLYPPGEFPGAVPTVLMCIFASWGLALLLIAAKARQRAEGGSFYASLYAAKLGLIYTFAMSSVLLGLFWLLLLLWAQLFKVVGIHLFADLFSGPLFSYGASGAVFALALALTQDRIRDLGVVFKRIISFCAWMLPLACLIALLFLAVLPFTGLHALWDTGHATALMLTLQLVVIIMLAGTYDDGTVPVRYPQWLKHFVTAALVVLPVYTLLSAYALGLRVIQHGWSAERVWAAYGIMLIGIGAFGAAWATLVPGEWLKKLERVNTYVLLALLAVVAGAGTPILNPERIGATSQVNRLLNGHIKAEKFDYSYLHFGLGTYGTKALSMLSVLNSHPEAETIRLMAKTEMEKKSRYARVTQHSAEALAERVDVFPEGEKADPEFFVFLQQRINAHGCLDSGPHCTLLKTDLNGDGEAEYVILDYSTGLYGKRDGKWAYIGNLQNVYRSSADWMKDLKSGGFSVAKPQWGQLIVGKHRLNVWEQPKPIGE